MKLILNSCYFSTTIDRFAYTLIYNLRNVQLIFQTWDTFAYFLVRYSTEYINS